MRYEKANDIGMTFYSSFDLGNGCLNPNQRKKFRINLLNDLARDLGLSIAVSNRLSVTLVRLHGVNHDSDMASNANDCHSHPGGNPTTLIQNRLDTWLRRMITPTFVINIDVKD
jgi:hypothetical protein